MSGDRIHDKFNDAVIDIVAGDRGPRDSEGRVIPQWPTWPSPPEVDIAAPSSWPIQPLNRDLIQAHQSGNDVWDGTKTSYFRDLVTIAEKQARASALVRAQIEGTDYMPPLHTLVPSRSEYLSGGVEGAIARSSEAAMQMERRVREVRRRIGADRPQSLGELRDISSGTGGVGLMPQNGAPMYVAELFADAARTKARLAPQLFQGQLPASGNIVLVPRSTTGAVMTVQTAEGTSYTDSASVFDTASSPVITIIGKEEVSRQLLDRGVNVDADIAASLDASFGAVLEAQVINGSGTSGELTGLLNVSGITANTYTDASPSASKNFGALQKLLSDTGTAYGAPVDAAVFHTRRLRFMTDNAVVNQVLDGSGIGVPNVIETQGMPTNLGTTQDALLVLALKETPVFIGPIRFTADADVVSGTGQVRLYAYAYVAMVGARVPASIGKATGSGLTTPTFP